MKCFEYITDVELREVKEIESKLAAGENPMIFKKRLAFELTKMLNDAEQARKAEEIFRNVFSKRQNPEQIDEYELKKPATILELLMDSNLCDSKSQARRMVEQGAVKIDGKPITDIELKIENASGSVIKVGKLRFLKIK